MTKKPKLLQWVRRQERQLESTGINVSNIIMSTDGDCEATRIGCGESEVSVKSTLGTEPKTLADPSAGSTEGPQGESIGSPRPTRKSGSKILRDLARTWLFGRRTKSPERALETSDRWETFQLCPSDNAINIELCNDPPLDKTDESSSETRSLRSEDKAVVDGVMITPQFDTQQHNATDNWPGPLINFSRGDEPAVSNYRGEVIRDDETPSGVWGLCGLCSVRRKKRRKGKRNRILNNIEEDEDECCREAAAPTAAVEIPGKMTEPDDEHEDYGVDYEITKSYSDLALPSNPTTDSSYSSGIESSQLGRHLINLEAKDDSKSDTLSDNADCWSVVGDNNQGSALAMKHSITEQTNCCNATIDVCLLHNEVLGTFSHLEEPYRSSDSRATYVIATFDYPMDSNNNAAVEIAGGQDVQALPGGTPKPASFLSLIKEARTAGMVPPSLAQPSYAWEKKEAPEDDCMTLPSRTMKKPDKGDGVSKVAPTDGPPQKTSQPVETQQQQNQNSMENKAPPSLQNVIETMQKLNATEKQVKVKREAEHAKKVAEEAKVATTAAEVMKKSGAPVDYKERKRLRQQKEMEEARKELMEATQSALKDRRAFSKKDEKNDSTEVSNKLFCGSTQAMFDHNAPIGEPQEPPSMPPPEQQTNQPQFSPIYPPNSKLEDIGRVPSPLTIIEEPKKEVLPNLPSVDTVNAALPGDIEITDVTQRKKDRTKAKKKRKRDADMQFRMPAGMGVLPMSMPNVMLPQPMGVPVQYGMPQCTPMAMAPMQYLPMQANPWGPMIPQMMMSNHGRVTGASGEGRKCKTKPKKSSKKTTKSSQEKTTTNETTKESTRKRDCSFSSFSDTSSFSSGSSCDSSTTDSGTSCSMSEDSSNSCDSSSGDSGSSCSSSRSRSSSASSSSRSTSGSCSSWNDRSSSCDDDEDD